MNGKQERNCDSCRWSKNELCLHPDEHGECIRDTFAQFEPKQSPVDTPESKGESVRDELISDIFSDRIRSIIEKETLEKVKVRLQNVQVFSYDPVVGVVGKYFREIQKMIYEIEDKPSESEGE